MTSTKRKRQSTNRIARFYWHNAAARLHDCSYDFTDMPPDERQRCEFVGWYGRQAATTEHAVMLCCLLAELALCGEPTSAKEEGKYPCHRRIVS